MTEFIDNKAEEFFAKWPVALSKDKLHEFDGNKKHLRGITEENHTELQ